MNGLSEAVLVCKGELSDPTFSLYLARVKENLQKLLNTDRETFLVSKLEKWNSVRVTFHLPGSAARRLHRLAKHQPQLLFRLGVHSVQVEGNDTVSITLREPQNVAGSSSDHDPLSASSRVESGLGSSRASSDANGHPLSASGVSYGASSSNTPHSCDVLPVSSDPSQGATQHDIIANCSTSAMHQTPAATLQHQGGSPTATSRASSSGASSTNAPYPLANMEQMAASAAAVAPNAPPHPPPLQTSLASSTSALGNNSSPLLVNLLRTSSPGAGAGVAHPYPPGQYGAVASQQHPHAAADAPPLPYQHHLIQQQQQQEHQQQLQHQQQQQQQQQLLQQQQQQQQQPPAFGHQHSHIPPNYAPPPQGGVGPPPPPSSTSGLPAPNYMSPQQRFLSHPPGGATIAYQPPPDLPPAPKKRKKPTKKQQKEMELQQMQQQGYFATSAAAANAHTVDRPAAYEGGPQPGPMGAGGVMVGGPGGPSGPGQLPSGGPPQGGPQTAPPPGYGHYYAQPQHVPQQVQAHHHGYPPGYHPQQQQQQQQQQLQQQHMQQQQQWAQQQHPQQQAMLGYPQGPQQSQQQQQQQQAWGSPPQPQMPMHMQFSQQHSQQQHGYPTQYAPGSTGPQYPQGYHHPQSSGPSSQYQQPSPMNTPAGGAPMQPASQAPSNYPPRMLRPPQPQVAPLSFQQPPSQMTASSPSMVTSSPMTDDRPLPTTPNRKQQQQQPSTPANSEHIDTTIDAVIQSAAAEARLLSAASAASTNANSFVAASSYSALVASTATAAFAVDDDLAMISSVEMASASIPIGQFRSPPTTGSNVADQSDSMGAVQSAPTTSVPQINGRDSPLMAKHASAPGLLNGMMMTTKVVVASDHQLHADMKPLPMPQAPPLGLSVQISPSTAAPSTSTGSFLRPSPAGGSAPWTSLLQDDAQQPSTSSALTTAPPAGGRKNRRKADLSQEASPQDDEIIMATTADSVGGGRSQARKNNNAGNSNFSSLTPTSKQNAAEGRKRARAGSRDSSTSGSSSMGGGSKRQSMTPSYDSREPSPVDLSQPPTAASLVNCRQSVDLALHHPQLQSDHHLLLSATSAERATPSNGDTSPSSSAPAVSPVPAGSALPQNARPAVRRSKR